MVGGKIAHRFLWPTKWGPICQHFEISIPFFTSGQTPPYPRWWYTSVCARDILYWCCGHVWLCVSVSICGCMCVSRWQPQLTCPERAHVKVKVKCSSSWFTGKEKDCFCCESIFRQFRTRGFQTWLKAMLGRKHKPSLRTPYEGHANHKYLALLNASIY